MSTQEIIEKYKDTPEEVTEADIVDLNLKWKDYNDSVAQYKKALSVYNNTLKEYNELKDNIKSIPSELVNDLEFLFIIISISFEIKYP